MPQAGRLGSEFCRQVKPVLQKDNASDSRGAGPATFQPPSHRSLESQWPVPEVLSPGAEHQATEDSCRNHCDNDDLAR